MDNTTKVKEQLSAVNQANVDTALRYASIILGSAERMIAIQVEAAKTAFATGAQNAKALSSVKDVQELDSLRANLVKPSVEQASEYARSIYNVATSTQAELSKLVEEQAAEFNRQMVQAIDSVEKTSPAASVAVAAVKSAITAANTAYENLSKTAKQFQESAEATMNSVAAQASNAAAQTAAASKKKSG
ncbi:MAG: phasin family protein [Burkholderiales bacterium]|nr:phasin family protein [Burkholderiales bacterium]